MNKTKHPNWHHKIIADKLTDVANGKIKRIMFLVPPRHGKTELVSRRMPSFFLEENPDKKCILVSYSAELAEALGEDVPKDFRDRFIAVGVHGVLAGAEADLILIDDPTKNYKEAFDETSQSNLWRWYEDSLMTKLKPTGAVVLIMNKWCPNDLASKLLCMEGEQKWEVLEFPAIYYKVNDFDPRAIGQPLWRGKADLEKLQAIRSNDPIFFEAVYQQRPIND